MTVEIITPPALARWRDIAKPETRRRIFAVVADKVENLVRRHILRIAPAHHTAAERLGATPTNHLTKGARTTVSHAGDDFAEVVIPIPGISRAFKNLTITPKKAPFLTLPLNAVSYGKRAAEVRRIGWMLFRPPAKGAHRTDGGKFDRYQDVLMGSKDGETIPLYLLKKRVNQPQDRSLLPSDAEISRTAGAAMLSVIRKYQRGAA